MGEVKNAFIKSKMNKDLDSRLLPSGEYRHAQNSQVSKSEGADVGSLENVLGNKEVANLTNGVINISSIGYFVDESSNNVYIFLTDNNTANYVPSGPGSNHYIYKYNVENGSSTKLVEGAFLNFSKLNPIFGVNLLENLLFWTDNRNQPRKINVDKSLGYYTTEDHISVAKFYPFKSIELFKESPLAALSYETTMQDVVSKNLPNGGSATISAAVVNSNTFDISNLNIPITPNTLEQGFTVSYIDANGDVVDTNETISSFADPTVTLTGNVDIPLTTTVTQIIFNANPYYDKNYSGDPSFIEDKFVRFSYRFRFDDGEYSLIAPFTQTCFIPKQDGYFLNREQNIVGPDASADGDELQTIKSTIVKFMENKVNKIYLQIPLPTTKSDFNSLFHVQEIDIILKESDGLALQVLDTIEVDQSFTGAENVLEYEYLGKKPYKTLPSNEVTRVYDKVPLKALAQEVISNRVVYGNYINKPTPPSFLNYNVSATEKYDFNLNENRTSVVEYPSSSLKTNREYQIGFVLADRYGRQSSVILSNNKDAVTVGNTTYIGSSLFSPYIDKDIGDNIDSWVGNSLKILLNDPIPGGVTGLYNGKPTEPGYNPTGWYSYKIVVKQNQQEYYNVYAAGAVKGDPFNNALDLNNTYISLESDNINKIPRDLSEVGPDQKQYRSSVVLYPRVNILNRLNLNEGDDNIQFYPDKNFFTVDSIQEMYDTFNIERFDATATSSELYIFQNAKSNPLLTRVTTSSDPNEQFGIIAEGALSSGSMKNLVVLETSPVVSRLDIFWETSTSGTIADLNTAVAGNNYITDFSSSFNSTFFSESLDADDNIFNASFTPVNSAGFNVDPDTITSFTLEYVRNNQSTPMDVSSYFTFYEVDPEDYPGFYNIKVTNDFVNNVFYGSDASNREFNFRFSITITGTEPDAQPVTSIIDKILSLTNDAPTMTPNGTLTIDTDGSTTRLTTLTSVNGASTNSPNKGKDISWFIESQSGANSGAVNYFRVSFSNTDLLSTCNLENNRVGDLPADIYTVVLKTEDAGGLTDSITITINNSVEIGTVTEYTFTDSSGGLPQDYKFVVIEVTGASDTDLEGFYAYLGDWATLSFGFTVEIDNTNSVGSGSCPSPLNGGWIFRNTGETAVSQATECLLPGFSGLVTSDNPDTRGYVFTIV